MPGLGIIGFERSGKTSLFNAVTGSEHAVGFATHQEPHVGVAKVPDARLERLSAMYRPKKTTPASLSYVDFPGASFRGAVGPASGPASGPGGDAGGPQVRFLDELSQQDALIHVVRAFDNDAVPHPRQRVDPARDIEDMLLELVFADMALIEKRLDRIAAETKALKAAERERADRDAALLRRLNDELSGGAPVRAVALSDAERKELRHYRFLTDRPLLTLLNIDEADAGRAAEIAAEFRPAVEPAGTATAAACAALEMELQGLTPDEAAEYRREIGASRGRARGRRAALLPDPGPALLLHRRRGRMSRLDDPGRAERAGGRRPHPLRPGARLHPRRGRGLAGPARRRLRSRGPQARPAAHRGQGVRRAGRRCRARPVQRMSLVHAIAIAICIGMIAAA